MVALELPFRIAKLPVALVLLLFLGSFEEILYLSVELRSDVWELLRRLITTIMVDQPLRGFQTLLEQIEVVALDLIMRSLVESLLEDPSQLLTCLVARMLQCEGTLLLLP